MNTIFQTKEQAIKSRRWVLVDAAGIPLGRLASQVAGLLRGKHKASFTPHVDGGDFVVVVNASQVKFTGKKLETKKYYSHSGYIGGVKEIIAGDFLKKSPRKVIERAVKGMLPKGPLGYSTFRKLKVYAGSDHPHKAQMMQSVK